MTGFTKGGEMLKMRSMRESLIELADMRPVGEKELLLTWGDGHRALYSFSYLRFMCPCAGCVDEHTGVRTIKVENVPDSIKAAEFKPVGLYALQFRWSDGHQTGLYSFDYLRKICPCGQCGGK